MAAPHLFLLAILALVMPTKVFGTRFINYKQIFGREVSYKQNLGESVVYDALRAKPSSSNSLICVAVPWGGVIEHFRAKHSTVKLKVSTPVSETVLTVCMHELYEWVIPVLEAVGVTHLFVPDVREGLSKKIKILPNLYHIVNAAYPAEEKDILYSFIGYSTHPLRKKIISMPKHKDTLIKGRMSWHYLVPDNKKRYEEWHEYRSVLSRSRFSLCPRGNSPNSLRLTESLLAGAIPIVIADDLRLPPGVDWDSYVIRIREKDVDKIDQIIRSISPEHEERMRAACIELGRVFKEDPAYFIRYYFDHVWEDIQ